MSAATYEFPLNERMRNYLRVEHLVAQSKAAAAQQSSQFHLTFFTHLFTLLDLIERIDIRADVVKELDTQERNLVHWSQHPNINNDALTKTLESVIQIRDQLKSGKKPGSELKHDGFLQSIRQRFSIPGATCSFDLPHLHFWFNKSEETKANDLDRWLSHVSQLDDAITLLLSFLRQRSHFVTQSALNGFYQGDAEDKSEIIRVRLPIDASVYPTLSGNKYRYALRFMKFGSEQPIAAEEDIEFEMASCR